jgi:superfamily II DNA/RNA helicase
MTTALLLMFLIAGVAALVVWLIPKIGSHLGNKIESKQQMLFMSAALDTSDDLTRALSKKMDARSIEITKADGRFLVTPADMKQAYEEIIREEHM